MPTITAIEEQKKNKNRFSIFIDGEFFKGVMQDVIFKLNLFKGKEVNQNELAKILESEEFEYAKSLALKYLSIRQRTSFEIQKYLKKKNIEEATTKKVIQAMKTLGLINDEEYSKQYALELIKKGKAGYKLILNKLRNRGIKTENARDTLKELLNEDEELQIALNLAKKKLKLIAHKEKQKKQKSINDCLIRKGFNFHIVNTVMNKLFKAHNDSDS